MIHLTGMQNIVHNASGLKAGEKALILGDESTRSIVELFYHEIIKMTANVDLMFLRDQCSHGVEPDRDVAEKMLHADVVFCLTKHSLAHTQARIDANRKGIRFLSLPNYTQSLLDDEALLVDFKYFLPQVQKITAILTEGKKARVISKNGTDIVMEISKRKGNCCTGFVDEIYLLGSPPDIEANIAPLEENSNGIIVVDGSIPCDEIGLLDDPVIMTIRNGFIVDIKSERYKNVLGKMMDIDKKKILAELGIGFNDKAKICGNMLIDEGARGCIHFGFGSNSTIGGQNDIGFHMDFILKTPSLLIDDKTIVCQGAIL